MRNWFIRIGLVAIVALLTLVGSARPVGASLGFCRADPIITFVNREDKRTTLVLSAGVALPSSQVTNVAWTVNLPANSTRVRVSKRGSVAETVNVISGGGDNVATVVANATANDSAAVTVDAHNGRSPHGSKVSASGTTNSDIVVRVELRTDDSDHSND